MKLKVTRILLKEIKKELNTDPAFAGYDMGFFKIPANRYGWHVDLDIYSHENDFDEKNNAFNVWAVLYPPKYYANNKYITTNDLATIFRHSNRTWAGFVKEFKNFIEI